MNSSLKVRGYTVAQFPNAPLAIAILAAVASRFFDEGSVAHGLSRAVFYAALTIWAYMELADGVNLFRRVLGALGIAFVLISITRDLS
ncbi:MAG: hypothetical protein IPK93_10140 [Solirubrobacterales bacterium]|nr:hypothetical protein [Solirubrobacterales bacterium]